MSDRANAPRTARWASVVRQMTIDCQSEDVLVDIRGNIFVSHKNQGIWVLRYTGEE